MEVQKGGVWPDLLERNSGLLGQDTLKFQSSPLLSGAPNDGTARKLEETKTSGSLPGDPPQANFPHPWGSRAPARRAKALAGSANLYSLCPAPETWGPMCPMFQVAPPEQPVGSITSPCRLGPSGEYGEMKVQQEQTWPELSKIQTTEGRRREERGPSPCR